MYSTGKFKYNCIVFDLDGTLVSSHKTIYRATLQALKELDIEAEIAENDFNEMIGFHFRDIFTKFDIIVNDFENFIKIYKRYYFDFIDTSELYPNVKEFLNFLHQNNVKKALLTTKMQDQAEMISYYFKLDKYFEYIMGRRNNVGIKPSAEPLLMILKELDVSPENALIVGDTEMDIQCGKNARVDTCAVTFGYRDISKLKAESPDFIIDSIVELKNIIET